MPDGVLRETPQVVSRIDTTPDTAAGRVRIHFDLQEQGKGPVRGMVGLEPDQAVKLANNLHKDAAFVNRYKKKRR